MRGIFSNVQRWFEGRAPNHLRQNCFSEISATGPLARRTSVGVENIHEVGIETTDTGPFVEDVFWLINRDTDAVRIPQQSPAFQQLMDYFGSFDGFDWKQVADAMCCTDCRYLPCWKSSEAS